MSEEGKRLLLEQAQSKTKTQLARELGYSRTTLSLVLSGKYGAESISLYEQALETYGKVQCPYLLESITHAECKDYSERSMPEGKDAVRHWRTCKSCDFRP